MGNQIVVYGIHISTGGHQNFESSQYYARYLYKRVSFAILPYIFLFTENT